GIALMRHGGRTAATASAKLRHFADFSLHHQTDVACNLAQRSAENGARTHQSCQPIAVGVPGRIRPWEIQFGGQRPGDLWTFLSKCSESARSSAKLKKQGVGECFGQLFFAATD